MRLDTYYSQISEMPGVVDVASLSSNWKKLQQTLKPAPKKNVNDRGVKRKREREPFAPSKDPNNPNTVDVSKKRVRIEAGKANRPIHKNKMGNASSKVPGDEKALVTGADDTSMHSRVAKVGRPSLAGSTETLVNQGLHPTHKPGKFLALDCEMVGTGPPPADENVLARVSIVNFHGEQVYDSYVQPPPDVQVTDYRTFVSGIRPQHLHADVARPFAEVQKQVSELLDGKVLVGHALKNDMAVLLLSHPQRDIRDTARHANFRKISMGKTPALRKLAKERLGMEIQGGEHSSVEDARATMLLFKLEKDVFEKENTQRYGPAMRRERKVKEVEAKRALKALPKQVMEDSDKEDEDEESDDEDVVDENGEFTLEKKSGGGKTKRKNKKKKRTKRA